jgi:lysophospholipase L1-like esterase
VTAVGCALAVLGYAWNRDALFFPGVLLGAGALAVCSWQAVRRGARWLPLVLNTALALLLSLVVLEPFLRPRSTGEPAQAPAVYRFDDARADPRAFRRWAESYQAEWDRTRRLYLRRDPRGVNPMVPIPGSRFRFFDSPHRINALGFRGREIGRDKGAAYRIVALGESTTFGATIGPADRPWPEVLEKRIAEELDCARSVQVVNAGVPGWTLANNLARLDADIWPLDPDLIVSYHGYNGFPYLIREIPSIRVGATPAAPARPSELLRRVERRLRGFLFRRRYRAARDVDLAAIETDLHLTRYAELYRELVFDARGAGVDLVLATFNLAVDRSSPEEVIEFYELMFPDIRARMLANRLHTRLVREIGSAYDVPVIDTSPDLDGAYRSAYIDPMHFTQEGRDRLAHHILDGIRDLLASGAGCTHRDPTQGKGGDAARHGAP